MRRGLGMIDVHGGCYIGDVVGLGKTFVGAELLRQLRFSYPHDGPPLILCPAGLIPMWQSFNERFGLGAEVVSHGMIVPAGEPEFDEELGRYVDAALRRSVASCSRSSTPTGVRFWWTRPITSAT